MELFKKQFVFCFAMKGKRLFELIKTLSKSERRQMHFLCSASHDKRHTYVKQCLDISTLEEFQSQLDSIGGMFKHLKGKKKDEALNRIIYFARQEIEDLKVKNFLSSHSKERYRVLAEIAYLDGQYDLFNYYSEKVKKETGKEKDYITEMRQISLDINLHLRVQQDENYLEMLRLLQKKQKLLDNHHQLESANHFWLMSSVCMDDSRLLEEMKNEFPTKDRINQFVLETERRAVACLMKMSEARSNFFELDMLQKNIQEAEELIRKYSEEDEECRRQLPTVTFLKILMGIQYGYSLEKLLEWSQEMFQLSEQFKMHETIGYFFHLVFLLLDNKNKEYKELSLKRNSLYFNKDNLFYLDFLNGLSYFMNQDYDKALDYLKELVYNDSHYIALWSRFLEIRIHFELENHEFLESLITRTKRFLDNNAHKRFTQNSALCSYKFFAETLKNGRYPSNNLEGNHFSLFQIITKNN